MAEPERAEIRHGLVLGTKAGGLGGVDTFIDERGARVACIAVMPEDDSSTRVEVRVGDTFEIGNERWRVDDIYGTDPDDAVTVIVRIQ